jgi:hypothetical protein
MKIVINEQKWNECTEEFAIELSECTNMNGYLLEISIDKLPETFDSMEGLNKFYTSGYGTIETIQQDCLSAIGEFVLLRDNADVSKAYSYIFGKHENGKLYYNGPHKKFENHYSQKNTKVSIPQLFGNVNKNKLKNSANKRPQKRNRA